MNLNRRSILGVVSVVDIVLMLIIVTSLISGIMLWAVPYMEKQKVDNAVKTMTQQFTYLNNIISDISAEGENATRYMTLVVERGYIKSFEEDILVVWYSLNSSYNFTVDGLGDGDKNFTIYLLDDGDSKTKLKIDSLQIVWIDEKRKEDYNFPFPLKEGGNFTKEAERPLLGAVEMIFKNEKTPVGKLWLFSMKGLSYVISYSGGIIKINEEIGAVFSIYGDNAFMVDDPPILRDDENLLIRFIQIYARDFSYIGEGIWHLILSINSSQLLEIGREVYNVRIEIHGCINESMSRYMTETLGFSRIGDDFYLSDTRLTFMRSICEVSLQEVII